MTRLPASDVAPEALHRVVSDGERVVLETGGRAVAALVSIEDLRLIEAEEDRLDNEAANAALAEGGESVPLEKVKKNLGLD